MYLEGDRKRKRVVIEIESDSDDGLDDADKELQAEEEDDDETNRLIMSGSGFDKSQDYDGCLDEPNPWHGDLQKTLRPSQIIGFRWMLDRHSHGGGLVADKVGTGKVCTPRKRE